MLRNTDRFAHWSERGLHIGDRVRFPIGSLGRDLERYRHTWEVISFGGYTVALCGPGTGHPEYRYRPQWHERTSHAHRVTVRRLCDGLTRTVGAMWVAGYRGQFYDEDGAWLDASLGHRNERRLAIMRNDTRHLDWQRSAQAHYRDAARFRERQRRQEERRAA
jgi:hypothetical protein